MKHHSNLFWLVTGLAIASAVPAVQAAKPTAQELEAKAAKLAAKRSNFKQPRTMKEGEATEARLANGTTRALVPTELWNQLAVEKDAQGNLKIVEADATAAPAAKSEGLSHE